MSTTRHTNGCEICDISMTKVDKLLYLQKG
jgi:hypothetical protein